MGPKITRAVNGSALIAAAVVALAACSVDPELPDARPLLTDEFVTIDGGSIDLATLQGRDVVLWFWAPW